MHQANHEAKSTVIGLIIVVVAWIALGFGVAATGAELFHTPLWVITGTVGTWIVAIVVAVVLSKRVIVDTDLDDAPSAQGASNVRDRQPKGPGEDGRST